MELTAGEFSYLGRCLEGFFYGLYSGIFAMYLQCHASTNDADRAKNTLFYTLCLLYILSAPTIVLDIISSLPMIDTGMSQRLYISSGTIFGCCDFISQSILIYRCWIVWGQNIRVVIIPLILTFSFLVLWLSLGGSYVIVKDQILIYDWGQTVVLTSLAISMTVDALVMGLIVLKIFKVFLGVKATAGERNLGATGGRKLRAVLFILVESGMALFSVQFARLVVTILSTDNTAYNAYTLIASIHEMLNGITPTIILVRVSMGLSFHDENSMVAATASLCFASDHPNLTPEIAQCISIVDQDSDFGVQLSDNIEMVDR